MTKKKAPAPGTRPLFRPGAVNHAVVAPRTASVRRLVRRPAWFASFHFRVWDITTPRAVERIPIDGVLEGTSGARLEDPAAAKAGRDDISVFFA